MTLNGIRALVFDPSSRRSSNEIDFPGCFLAIVAGSVDKRSDTSMPVSVERLGSVPTVLMFRPMRQALALVRQQGVSVDKGDDPLVDTIAGKKHNQHCSVLKHDLFGRGRVPSVRRRVSVPTHRWAVAGGERVQWQSDVQIQKFHSRWQSPV